MFQDKFTFRCPAFRKRKGKIINYRKRTKMGVKAADVVEKLKIMKLINAAELVLNCISETLTYMLFPREHWIRTNNPMKRIMKEFSYLYQILLKVIFHINFPDIIFKSFRCFNLCLKYFELV